MKLSPPLLLAALFTLGLSSVLLGCSFDPAGLNNNSNNIINTNNPNNTPSACGNGTLDATETCDGTALNGATCASLGQGTGTLACQQDCAGYDTSGCVPATPECGNNLLEAGEVCDGTDLNNKTCADFGFTQGNLRCAQDCQGYDPSLCSGQLPQCGDGILQTDEVCDGTNLNGETCLTQDFAGGELACIPGCTAFDTSNCDVSICGDGLLHGTEVCDGTNLNGETCISQGFVGGTLACAANCTFDTTGCLNNICGNGILEPEEVCDGTNLNGETCISQGFVGGTLACAANCTFDTTGCLNNICGNGILEPEEECDPTLPSSTPSCVSVGCSSSADVLCTADCNLDYSSCFVGHDEDGDTVDDNCDNCPTQPNQNQDDPDNDGVGYVCDPTPSSPANTIAAFDSFYPAPNGNWTSVGLWSSTPDVVSATAYALGAANRYDDFSPTSNQSYTVETTYSHTREPSSIGSSKWVTVLFGLHLHGGGWPLESGYECAVDRIFHTLSIWKYGSAGWGLVVETPISSTPPPSTANKWRRLSGSIDPASGLIHCSYEDEDNNSCTLDVTESGIDTTNSFAGLAVDNEASDFSSFIIYQ